MIPDEIIAEVLERVNVVEFVGRHVNLKKAGTLYKGLCPFHDEKTPSFTVSPTRNTYHCFGCGAHGHAIKFLMEVGARNFPEAVRELAAEVGVEVPESRPQSAEEKRRREQKKTKERRLLDAQDRLTSYYADQLYSQAGERAQRYLSGRGMSRRAAEAFRLGWASGDKRAFAQFLEANEISLADMVDLGVVMEPKDGWKPSQVLDGGYLRFRERLMFPVVDFRGDVTGYSGRILDANKKIAKYMNSPETPVFTKGQQLYGAFTARSAARKASRVILVEGNVDVIALWDQGLEGTVAAMGTALTPEQVRLVKRLNTNCVCVMDGDAAGLKAAFSSLGPFLDAGLQPRAVILPDGDDPDSYVQQHGVDRFVQLLDDARPLLDIMIDHEIAQQPDDTPGRLAALRNLAPALTKLSDTLSRELYISQLVDKLGVSNDFVNSALAEVSERRPPAAPIEGPAGPPAPLDLPPPLMEMPYPSSTGMESPQFDSHRQPPEESFFLPGYVSQMLVFIMQFPSLVVRLYEAECQKYLTQPGLIGFFHCLYNEVSVGKSPNMDRILNGLDDAQTTAFLRGLQAMPLAADAEVVEQAFEEALLRLQRGALEADRSRLSREIRDTFSTDPIRCAELNDELKRIRAALANLSAQTARGAV